MADLDDDLQPEEPSTLSDDQLIELMWMMGDRLSRGVIDEIASRSERMLPRLAEVVHTDETWEDDLGPPGMWAVVHATFALSATGSMDAVPPLLEAVRRAHVEGLDWITEVGGELFNRIGPGCFEQVRAVFLSDHEDPFVRWGCLTAMCSLSLLQEGLQTVVIRDAASACKGELGLDLQEAGVWALADYHALGRAQEVLEALGLEELPALFLEYASDEPFWYARRDPLSFYDPSAIEARQERWRREDAEDDGDDDDDDDGDDGDDDLEGEEDWLDSDDDDHDHDDEWRIDDDSSQRPPGEGLPFVRAEPKIGRNDPCPCGSGRKFKKCCERLA